MDKVVYFYVNQAIIKNVIHWVKDYQMDKIHKTEKEGHQ
jgi:hypothetical protein